ncbi:acetyltransferase [Peribacillus sp. SCS-37]|uniref:acetyltransferase n=1 Tax=Paraperibacillus esterisolvens TaxID=3115296 RepID=UPI0039069B34
MKIIIIGHGGHSRVIQDLVIKMDGCEIAGFLDERYKELKEKEGLYYGPVDSIHILLKEFTNIKAVLGIGDNQTRKMLYERLNIPLDNYTTLIHKSAIISPSATIGNGTVIMANTVINSSASIGNHSIINTGAIIEHDNKISNYVHISPGATLTGAVKVCEGVHVGAGAIVIPGVRIKEWSVIGAGAVVTKDIPSNCKATGVPAKVKTVKVGV